MAILDCESYKSALESNYRLMLDERIKIYRMCK